MSQTVASSNLYAFKAIVIRGLPGVGKTTLANCILRKLQDRGLPAFQINADEVRASVNKGLGFSEPDRIENARRIGGLTRIALSNSTIPVVDFVMPTKNTYDSFVDGIGGHPFWLWSLRPHPEFQSRFQDTAKLFQRPQDWWLGGLYDEKFVSELEPFREDQLSETADTILDRYHGYPDYLAPATRR